MSHQQNVNPNIPQDYQPAINDTNFSAPAHSHLNNAQKSAIVEIAEGTGHGQNSGSAFGGNLAQGNIGTTAGGLGQAGTHESTFTGLGGSSGSHAGNTTGSSNTSGGLASTLRDSLSGNSDSSRRHDGEYNMGQSSVPHNASGAGRDAAHLERSRNELANAAGAHGLGNAQGGSHGVGGTEGHGHGSRQAAGLGAGAGAGGLAAAASAQGLGGPSSVDRRSMEQERVGAHHGGVLDSSAPGQQGSSGSSGLTSGRTGHGNNMQEAMRDASSSSGHGAGAGAAGLGAAGAGAAGASALGGGSSHGQSSGSNTGGLLSKPKAPEGGLVNELEERARKSGTHAAGFGAHGNH